MIYLTDTGHRTARLFTKNEIVLPHSSGGVGLSGKLPGNLDLQNPDSMISQHSVMHGQTCNKDDGAEILRNAKFLKHMWQIPKPNHIAWADQQ